MFTIIICATDTDAWRRCTTVRCTANGIASSAAWQTSSSSASDWRCHDLLQLFRICRQSIVIPHCQTIVRQEIFCFGESDEHVFFSTTQRWARFGDCLQNKRGQPPPEESWRLQLPRQKAKSASLLLFYDLKASSLPSSWASPMKSPQDSQHYVLYWTSLLQNSI